MNPVPPDRTRFQNAPRPAWARGFAIACIGLAILVGYFHSLQGPFVLDDAAAILENPSLRDWHRPGAVLHPERGTTLGRPLLNLTFAVNWAWTGKNPWSYHLVNVFIHGLAAATLFGVVRRTLLLPSWQERFGKSATLLGFFVAMLWALHPLQTASVTYVSQRAESLMGLFYLLTVYLFLRGATSPAPMRWHLGSVAACYAGMAVKEVMVTAPVLIALFDGLLITGSLGAALRQRKGYYAGLASAWLFLAWLMITFQVGNFGIGFHAGVSWQTYALTEAKVVLKYLGLFFWPHPLVFDYGPELFIARFPEAIPYLLAVAALLAAAAILLRRRRPVGLAVAAYFLLLAPTSSIVPVALQPMAENRMYLPAIPLTLLVVLGAYGWLGRKVFGGLAIAILVLAALTIRRNQDYHTELGLWTDTLAKQPINSRALTHLGLALSGRGESAHAMARYEAALRLNPNQVEAMTNLAFELALLPDHSTEAISHYRQALRVDPNFTQAHLGLANELAKLPDGAAEAVTHYQEALRLNPYSAPAHYYFGALLGSLPGRSKEAIVHLTQACALEPDYFEAHYSLANAQAKIAGAEANAIAHYEKTLRLKPDFVPGHVSFGMLLAKQPGRSADAMQHYREALRLDPACFEAHNNLANELSKLPGHDPEAIEHYELALRLRPDVAEVHYNLAARLIKLPGRLPSAIEHYETVVKLQPNFAAAHYNLAVAYAHTGQRDEAIAHFETALRLDSSLEPARTNLEKLRALRR